MSELTVSVAIWTCNQERFIGATIESALAQDPAPMEIVVADDASEDRTPEIVAGYAERHPGIVRPLYNRGPRSIVANVNRALGACSGDLVAILDGDDLYRPGKLAAQVAVFAERPDVVLCHHPVQEIDSSGRVLRVLDLAPDLVEAGVADLARRGNFVNTASNMMRRSAMPPIPLPPVVSRAPDFLLAVETALNGTILKLPEPLACYRRHGGQVTAPLPGSEVVFEDVMRVLDHLDEKRPDLATETPAGRAAFARWEAMRRHTSPDLAWATAGVRMALRHRPADRLLWRFLATTLARRALRRPRARPG